MATTSSRLIPNTPFEVLWFPEQPNEIHLVTNDPLFHDGSGGRPGMWTTYSGNPKSANWNRHNFNRCAWALEEDGQPAPAEVPEHDRLNQGTYAPPAPGTTMVNNRLRTMRLSLGAICSYRSLRDVTAPPTTVS